MENRSVTQGICDRIPVWLQNLMWYLWESIPPPERGYMQVFRLSCAESGVQAVQLSQKEPPYCRQVEVDAPEGAVMAKIYVLKDENIAVMMLESEF